MRSNRPVNPVLTDDDVQYICMSFSVLYHKALENDQKKSARRILSKMKAFVFQNLAACKRAAAKFSDLNDEQRAQFFSDYELSDEKKRYISIV